MFTYFFNPLVQFPGTIIKFNCTNAEIKQVFVVFILPKVFV